MAARYNERAWAIDLISDINIWASDNNRLIHRASGELGIRGGGKNFFPDVLLHSTTGILQGWELKFPDTPISDSAFLDNAVSKANILGTNSFVLWNALVAVLYVRDASSQEFISVKSWSCPGVERRVDVEPNLPALKALLLSILQEIESLIAAGEVVSKQPIDTIGEDFASGFIKLYAEADATKIREIMRTDEALRLGIQLWAQDSGLNPREDMALALAKTNLLSWVNRFLFAHYLASEFRYLKPKLRSLSSGTRVQIQELFDEVRQTHGFDWIFQEQLGDHAISQVGWDGRVSLNHLLNELEVNDLPREGLSLVLHSFQKATQHKSQGQYATPPALATLMAKMAMSDLTGEVWDPCSGSGTIAKALAREKEKAGIPIADINKQVWASDKHVLPLQLTQIALADPRVTQSESKVFQLDVFDSQATLSPVKNKKFSAIASNLPFVRFESKDLTSSAEVLDGLESEFPKISQSSMGRSDLFAPIVFKLRQSLSDNGQIVLLTSNSWIGTDWGQNFQQLLFSSFDVVAIVKSGAGRWFSTADVVTTALVLRHKSDKRSRTNFVTTLVPLSDWTEEYISSINLAAKLGTKSDGVRVASKDLAELTLAESLGFNLRIAFWDTPWLTKLSSVFVPVNSFFDVARGARRGWNALFYPDNSGLSLISAKYKKPLLKTTSGLTRLIADPDGIAFCCTDTLDDLERANDTGTRTWIDRFRAARNGNGKLITEVLKTRSLDWFQMDASELADICVSLAPYKTLAFYQFRNPTFVDQRLTRLTLKSGELKIHHALLNSCLGMLSLEFLGFGRALGVLDLSSMRIKERMRMLNTFSLTETQKNAILEAFEPLLQREIEDVVDELTLPDRIAFDRAVLDAYGLASYQVEIYSLLKSELVERTQSNQKA